MYMGNNTGLLKNPCKDCTERHAGCHGSCEKYKEFSEENTKLRNKIYEEKKINSVLKGYNPEKKKSAQGLARKHK